MPSFALPLEAAVLHARLNPNPIKISTSRAIEPKYSLDKPDDHVIATREILVNNNVRWSHKCAIDISSRTFGTEKLIWSWCSSFSYRDRMEADDGSSTANLNNNPLSTIDGFRSAESTVGRGGQHTIVSGRAMGVSLHLSLQLFSLTLPL